MKCSHLKIAIMMMTMMMMGLEETVGGGECTCGLDGVTGVHVSPKSLRCIH